jgi:AraC-like DNA-binding protein
MRASVLSSYSEVAVALGLNPRAMLQRVGLPSATFEEPDLLISADAVVELLELSANERACPDFALRMAERRQLSHFGVASLLLSQLSTVREAIRVAHQFRHLVNDALAVHLEETDGVAVMHLEVLTSRRMAAAQTTELSLAAVVQLIRVILGPAWRPICVHFRHPSPPDAEPHRRLFRCAVEFDALFNGVSFAAADLDRANPAADARLAAYAQGFLQALPDPGADVATAEVKRLIHLLLPLGRANLKFVAQTMGRNPRTLQRALDAEGLTFSALLDDARRDLALRYLADRRFSIGHVAAQLGYANHGAFTRWFVETFQMSPKAWRRQT